MTKLSRDTMIYEEQQRPTDGREQRSQCFRFCAVVMLILSTLVIVHLQQERSEEAARQRRKQRARLATSAAWQMDHFVKLPRTVLGLAYLSPYYESAPAIFETVSKDSLVIQPLLGRRMSGFVRDAGNHLVGSSEIVSDWVLSRQQIEPRLFPSSGSAAGASQEPSGHAAEIVAVAMDTHLHLSGQLPGCSREDLQHKFRCYIALLRLPAAFCILSTDADSSLKQGVTSVPWTCGDFLSSESSQSSDGPAAAKSCINVASGASLHEISVLAKQLYQQTGKKSQGRDTPPPPGSNVRAGLLLRFCGDPFHHRLAVDWQHRRIFFAQPVFPHKGSKGGGGTSQPHVRQLLNDEDALRPRSDRSEAHESASWAGDVPFITAPGGMQHDGRLLSTTESDSPGSATVAAGSDGDSPATDQVTTELSWRSSYCVVAAYLDTFYNDITECVPVPLPWGVGGRPPSFLHYDQMNQTLVTFDYDETDSLVVSFLDAYPSKLRFSVKLQHFQSGWLLASDDASKGKMLLLGDSPPYSGILEVVDIAAQQHRRLDFLGRPHL